MNLPIDVTFAPMEAKLAKCLPAGENYQFEPKWDGFRALCFRDGDEVEIRSKSGQSLTRYFPEVAAALKSLHALRFVLDGELVVPVDDRLDFDQLLQRIHPAASRVAVLSARYPATYIVFDLLIDEEGNAVYQRPLRDRRALLDGFAQKHFNVALLRLSPATTNRGTAERWRDAAGGALDGVIAKPTDIGYASGNRDGMVKVKHLRTADCIVGGFRLANDGKALGSLLLGLYDAAGALDYVGFTAGFSAVEKNSILQRLQRIRTDASFTARTPGGPSRWNRGKETTWYPVEPSIVLEVEFDHVSGGRFRHGTRPLRFRPDKAPAQCTQDQLGEPPSIDAYAALT